jgi:hypothetical protein
VTLSWGGSQEEEEGEGESVWEPVWVGVEASLCEDAPGKGVAGFFGK